MEKIIIVTEESLKALISDLIQKEATNLKVPEIQRDELITRNDAAKLLGISLPTLDKYALEGKIKSYRIGTRIRFKLQEILDSLKLIQAYKYR